MIKPAVAALLATLLVGCGPRDAVETATGVRSEIDTVDGVVRIRTSGVPPTWRLETLLTLGSIGTVGEPAPDEFGMVTSAIWGPGDRVYVADGMNQEVKVFDLDGSLALRFGRQGEGPGEFGSLYSLAWVGDTLLGLDYGVGRVALFDAEGRWLGQRRHAGSITGTPAMLRLYQTDADEAYAWSLQPTPDGSRRMYVRHTTAGAADTLWQLSADQANSHLIICRHPSGGIGFWDIPFFPRFLQHPARGQLIAAINTDEYEVVFLNSEGDTVRVVERVIDPVPTNAAEWDEGLREYRDFRAEHPGASCEPATVRRPDFQPPVRDLLLDSFGRLWVEAITLDGPYWEVFDPLGQLIGRIPTFPRSERTVPYFARDHIVAVATDSLDVQVVMVYEFGP
jgi:hypothetical protein